jgi:predicted PurR-regulated permease PerM
MNPSNLHHKTFLLLLIAITVGFSVILIPFYSPIFWSVFLAILLAPVQARMLHLIRRRNLATLATVLLFLVLIFIPLSLVAASLVREGASFYEQIRVGQIDFGIYFQRIISALPNWLVNLLSYFGVTNFATLKDALSSAAAEGSQIIAAKALDIGQITAGFVFSTGLMLYLLFFLLRDGVGLTATIKRAIPLDEENKQQLFGIFAAVVRATIKGNIVVAMVQGALGGLIFWILDIQGALLWSVVMALLSLIPAVGAALIWAPVAIYFLVSGAVWQGISLILYGLLVIGLVDNVLRPILVGKDTRMSDYVVLFSTLGGIVVFGLNGFVIGPVIAALFIAVWNLHANEIRRRATAPK